MQIKTNIVHRSSGVNGRVAAYQAAAELSQTPWFFAVFAKLRVNPTFDWAWQPDRLQEPKHYIFHAFNPTNGLTYGHQAMIAYNNAIEASSNFKDLTSLSIKALDRAFEYFEVESAYEVSTKVEEIYSVESFEHHHV
jgi:hypothetical protein